MAIVQVEEVTVVDVEVGDDYLVHVRQVKRHVMLTPTEALQLSQELAEAAVSARRLLGEQAERERARIAQQVGSGFDGTLESLRRAKRLEGWCGVPDLSLGGTHEQ